MAKIKFTKTELKKQQDELKQFQRFLPTLQLKKQQLQAELRQSTDLLDQNLAAQRSLADKTATFIELFDAPDVVETVEKHIRIARVSRGVANIAGIPVPTFEDVVFEDLPWDLLNTEWFFDDVVNALRQAVKLKEAYTILQEQYDLLSAELRLTNQRVNLFEKVKIPECKENIRKINIALGDANTAAVVRSKIAKRKVEVAS